MKNPLPWTMGLLAVGIGTLLAQVTPGAFNPSAITAAPQKQSTELARFSLNFSGGTPHELVAAIQQAMGRPLNAIIPDEYADARIPALKMTNVNVQELFSALQQASLRTFQYEMGPGFGNTLSQMNTSYGFKQGPGTLTDDTIWGFYEQKPPTPPIGARDIKVVRFYSLSPYLSGTSGDRHLTVDDITTAIETAWKMVGETSPPKISFHKDTNLLIAVGDPSKLETIDAALKALAPSASSAATGKAAAPNHSPRSAESSNSGSE